VVDANHPRLHVSSAETPWVPPAVNPDDPMGFWKSTMEQVHLQPKRGWVPVGASTASDVGYFLDCLDAGRDSELSAVEAAHTTEVLMAGYRSAATGEVVNLPLTK
jgi:myo-inositol 2-dehydrogenase / D-chiro-inositol 1-dehydrogenase